MSGIDEGIDERNRDGLDAEFRDGPRRALDLARIERALDAAIGANALGDAEPPISRHQRRLALWAQAIDIAPGVPADFQDVLESLGGDEGAGRQPPLQDRVGGDRGAVQQQADIRRRETDLPRRRHYAVDQSDRGIGGRRRHLQTVQRARALLEDLEVGKGAADVDGDANGWISLAGGHASP